MKKKLAVLLLLALLLPTVAACGESQENSDEPTASQQSAAAVPAESEEETESLTPYCDADAKTDLGGITIRATCDNLSSNYINVLDFDELTGEKLNDAMYERNRMAEEALNCTLSVDYGSAIVKLE